MDTGMIAAPPELTGAGAAPVDSMEQFVIWKEIIMPKKTTMRRAAADRRQGKAPTTQAGEFIKETMDEIREGKIGARSTKQAIAIGLSKARRAGVDLPPPKKGQASERTRKSAKRAYEVGQSNPNRPVNPKRSRAITEVLQREGQEAASHDALSQQAKQQARKRSAQERHEIGVKAARTRMAHQTHAERQAIARKAAHTRQMQSKSAK